MVKIGTIHAIHASEEIFYQINDIFPSIFPNYKFVFTPKLNRNITDSNEQEFLIVTEHERAHRNYKENLAQLKEKYFFPKMSKRIKRFVINCEICKKQKFDTHPNKQIMKPTPIPFFVGEFLQIDIFHVGKKIFYSTIDRFSKFVVLRYAENKLNAQDVIEEILQFFPLCKEVMTDNESIFTSFPMKSLFRRKKITHSLTPIRHSTSNAQVERFHRTLMEIARCLADQGTVSPEEIIFEAVLEYNNTIHSVIQAKPIDVFFNSTSFPNIAQLIRESQISMLNFQNRKRNLKIFEPGELIFVKNDRRDKRSPPYTKHVVKENRDMVVITTKDKEIHKDIIRN